MRNVGAARSDLPVLDEKRVCGTNAATAVADATKYRWSAEHGILKPWRQLLQSRITQTLRTTPTKTYSLSRKTRVASVRVLHSARIAASPTPGAAHGASFTGTHSGLLTAVVRSDRKREGLRPSSAPNSTPWLNAAKLRRARHQAAAPRTEPRTRCFARAAKGRRAP